MVTVNRRGQVIRVHAYSGQMRRHGGDRQQANQHATLDAVATRRVSYAGPGVLIRKVRKCRG